MPYLASGVSSYFNEQIEQKGLSYLKLSMQDIEDAKFISACFNKETNFSDNNLSILYTSLLGTVELNYASQSFPAGIFEDVFQCSVTHELPLEPIYGEKEVDYYIRVLEYQISQYVYFPMEYKEEALQRARRLAEKFCQGKNRVYLIPFDNVLKNKASFGDILGLRDGKSNGEELKKILDERYTFETLLEKFNIMIKNNPGIYLDANMTSEYGIAIYGEIKMDGVSYFEVDRHYELLQKKAEKLGYVQGDPIATTILFENQVDISLDR